MKDKPHESRLIIVSNAEPYKHVYEEDDIKQKSIPGGLTTALDPMMRDSNNLWIAWGRGEADFEVVEKGNKVLVPNEETGYTLKRLKLSKSEVESFYYGFSNKILWPLCHSFVQKAKLKNEFWSTYRNVNELYADAVLEEFSKGDRVWIHDYQLSLVPDLIREEEPEAKIALFWHIPFPPWEAFGPLPWKEELLKGILGADFIGFHTSQWLRNFFNCIESMGGACSWSRNIVQLGNYTAVVSALPLGIKHDAYTPTSKRSERATSLKENIEGEKFVISVDRLDYTKGIGKRLEAIEIFFEQHPEFQGEVTFIQKISPSRMEIPEYQKMRKDLERRIAQINGRFQLESWVPIRYFFRFIPQDKLISYYMASDVALITPLIDGMNLVAKEYIASQDDGVLILSEFAGATEMLNEAIQVNPYDPWGVADALVEALTMPKEKRIRRLEKMEEKVKKMDIEWWRDLFFNQWDQVYLQNKLSGKSGL